MVNDQVQIECRPLPRPEIPFLTRKFSYSDILVIKLCLMFLAGMSGIEDETVAWKQEAVHLLLLWGQLKFAPEGRLWTLPLFTCLESVLAGRGSVCPCLLF